MRSALRAGRAAAAAASGAAGPARAAVITTSNTPAPLRVHVTYQLGSTLTAAQQQQLKDLMASTVAVLKKYLKACARARARALPAAAPPTPGVRSWGSAACAAPAPNSSSPRAALHPAASDARAARRAIPRAAAP